MTGIACQDLPNAITNERPLPAFPSAMTGTDLFYGDGATPFVLDRRREDGTEFVALSGELDLATVERLRTVLAEAEAAAPQRIVLDLSALQFCDSVGMTEIAHASSRAQERGYELRIRRGPRAVHRVFEITGLDRGLPFEQD
jgi:anti-sigma B factor antagonist